MSDQKGTRESVIDSLKADRIKHARRLKSKQDAKRKKNKKRVKLSRKKNR